MLDQYSGCPLGIKNEQEIIRTQETFKMALERMEEKLSDLKDDVTQGFNDINGKLDKIEVRLNNYEGSLGTEIDKRIHQGMSERVFSLVKWIVVSLGGTVAVTVVANLIIQRM